MCRAQRGDQLASKGGALGALAPRDAEDARERRVEGHVDDARIAAAGAITFAALQPETRQAARELAAVVVEGLRAQAA